MAEESRAKRARYESEGAGTVRSESKTGGSSKVLPFVIEHFLTMAKRTMGGSGHGPSFRWDERGITQMWDMGFSWNPRKPWCLGETKMLPDFVTTQHTLFGKDIPVNQVTLIRIPKGTRMPSIAHHPLLFGNKVALCPLNGDVVVHVHSSPSSSLAAKKVRKPGCVVYFDILKTPILDVFACDGGDFKEVFTVVAVFRFVKTEHAVPGDEERLQAMLKHLTKGLDLEAFMKSDRGLEGCMDQWDAWGSTDRERALNIFRCLGPAVPAFIAHKKEFARKDFADEIRAPGPRWWSPPIPFHPPHRSKRKETELFTVSPVHEMLQWCPQWVLKKGEGGDMIEAGTWMTISRMLQGAEWKTWQTIHRSFPHVATSREHKHLGVCAKDMRVGVLIERIPYLLTDLHVEHPGKRFIQTKKPLEIHDFQLYRAAARTIRAIEFMNCVCGLFHRDIGPHNLGVRYHPDGSIDIVIIDMDSSADSPRYDDTGRAGFRPRINTAFEGDVESFLYSLFFALTVPHRITEETFKENVRPPTELVREHYPFLADLLDICLFFTTPHERDTEGKGARPHPRVIGHETLYTAIIKRLHIMEERSRKAWIAQQ
jgi:hypothetical protein